MQNQEIIQKRLWNEKEFKLKDGILYWKEMGLFWGYEVELRYEDIVSEKRMQSRPNAFLFVAASILMTLSIINLLGWINTGTGATALLGVLMASGIYWLTYQSAGQVLCLETVYNKDIKFFRDNKHLKMTDKFVEELLEQRKIFLVEKYWDCVDNYDTRIQNLNWLKDANIVNINEFKYLKEEMLHEVAAEIVPIGFRKCS